jgi:hypothetical protein
MVILGIKQAVVEKMKIWGGDYASSEAKPVGATPCGCRLFYAGL